MKSQDRKVGRRVGNRCILPDKWRPHRLNPLMPTKRHFYVEPKQGCGRWIEVTLARTRREMYVALWHTGRLMYDDRTMGGCVDYRSKIKGRPKLGWRHTVARVFLNWQDLSRTRTDTMTHETTHAAMAWVRYKRANLATAEGEEVLAYAVGHMAQEINNGLHRLFQQIY